MDRVFKSKVLSWGLIGCFILLFFPVEGLTQSNVGVLKGYVYQEDFETRVEGAVIKIKNISNDTEYESLETDREGFYRIANIVEGRYSLKVTTGNGDYEFDFEVFLKSGEEAELLIGLDPDKLPVMAVLLDKNSKVVPLFWLLGGAGALGLGVLGAVVLTGDDTPTSPATRAIR